MHICDKKNMINAHACCDADHIGHIIYGPFVLVDSWHIHFKRQKLFVSFMKISFKRCVLEIFELERNLFLFEWDLIAALLV